jgi:hypothetical protein
MALVDDDQIEEVRRQLAEQLFAILWSRDGLVEPEIHLVRRVNPPLPVDGDWQLHAGSVFALDHLRLGAQLGHRGPKRAEVVHHRLVHQHVAVGEVQNPLLPASLPQPPDDLERGKGLSGSSGHRQQQPVLTFGDRFSRRVDRAGLEIVRLLAAVVEVILENDRLCFGRQSLPRAVLRPQRRGRGELVELKVLLDGPVLHAPVVEDKAITVRREDERELQRLRVAERLLNAVTDAAVVVLRLEHRQRDVRLVVEDVVGALRFSPRDELAANDDASLCKTDFLAKLSDLIPAGLPERGRDELGADIPLAELLLVHAESVILRSLG